MRLPPKVRRNFDVEFRQVRNHWKDAVRSAKQAHRKGRAEAYKVYIETCSPFDTALEQDVARAKQVYHGAAWELFKKYELADEP